MCSASARTSPRSVRFEVFIWNSMTGEELKYVQEKAFVEEL